MTLREIQLEEALRQLIVDFRHLVDQVKLPCLSKAQLEAADAAIAKAVAATWS